MALNEDLVTSKTNKPVKRTLVYAFLLGFGACLAYALLSKSSKQEAKVEETEVQYRSAQPRFENPDRYLKAEEKSELDAETLNDVLIRVEKKQEEEEEEKLDEEPELKRPQAKKVTAKRRSRINPYSSSWLASQQQSFTASPTAGSWKSTKQEEQKSPQEDDKSAVKTLERIEREAKAYFNNTSGASNAQQTFFETAGKNSTGTLAHTRTQKAAPYVLPAGTLIPCVLISGINTDLPGNVIAQVRSDVYDWVDDTAVLIPQGSRVFGTYGSSVKTAQKRAQINWSRITYPDGTTLDLDGMPGVDVEGYSGVKDKYNAHYNSVLLATALTASFAALGDMFDDEDSNVYIGSDSSTTVEGEVAEALAGMGEKIFQKQIDRQPTIVVRPGKRFNIQVNMDIPFTRVWS